MSTRRYYLVTDKHRLVKASHPSTAVRHVADDAFNVRVASQEDLIACFEAGIKPENVAGEQTELPTT